MRTTVLCCAMMQIIAATLAAQTPMPSALVADFGKHVKTSDFFYYDFPATGAAAIRVGLSYKNNTNAEKKVVLTYFFKASPEDAMPGETIQEIGVSYMPTAICRRAGYTNRFYVVGWAERPSHAVVEEWTISGGALGVTQPLGGGHSQSDLALPIINKTLLVSASNMGPISSAACNPFANTLWLMEEAAPKKVWSVDIDDPASRTVMFDSTSDPSGNLAQCTSLTACKHSVAGFVIFFEQKRKWMSLALYQGPYPLRVFRDVNLDGTMEVVENRTFLDLYAAFPPSSWTIRYPE